MENTIELTKDIPETVAATGKVSMSRKKIMRSVGELFILRISPSSALPQIPANLQLTSRYQPSGFSTRFPRTNVVGAQAPSNLRSNPNIPRNKPTSATVKSKSRCYKRPVANVETTDDTQSFGIPGMDRYLPHSDLD